MAAMKASKINPPKSHKHDCGHFCFCHDPNLRECRKCAAAIFNKAMAEIYLRTSKGNKNQ